VCEITEPGLQDPYLLENNFYKDLPNLPYVVYYCDLFKSDPFHPPVVVETKIHISICNLCFPQPNKVDVQTFRDGYSCAHR
jgi:hypothetical protein